MKKSKLNDRTIFFESTQDIKNFVKEFKKELGQSNYTEYKSEKPNKIDPELVNNL